MLFKKISSSAPRSIFTLLVISTLFFVGCKKDNLPDDIRENNSILNLADTPNFEEEEVPIIELEDYQNLNSRSSFREWEVRPKFGKPGNTGYLFIAHTSDQRPLSLKLYDRVYNRTYYVKMNAYKTLYYVRVRVNISGVFDYRYVYTDDKEPISNTPSFNFTNSSVVFDRPYSHLVWPYGGDGSSWSSRRGWYRGGESNSCGGYAFDEGTHTIQGCYADDRKAQDWNRCSPYHSDNGATFKSPLDGKVVKVGYDSDGYGNYVDIEQTNSSGSKYIFRITHLKKPPTNIYTGRWVRAGHTTIGAVGSTGNSSGAHAHCVLYKVEARNGGRCHEGLNYKFDAN